MLKRIRQDQTNDYLVSEGKRELGMLYETEDAELGHCWVFCAQGPGISKCRALIYSSPEMAISRIPAEIPNRNEERELYDQTIGMIY